MIHPPIPNDSFSANASAAALSMEEGVYVNLPVHQTEEPSKFLLGLGAEAYLGLTWSSNSHPLQFGCFGCHRYVKLVLNRGVPNLLYPSVVVQNVGGTSR